MDRIKENEAIVDAYAESMRLPFRDAVEQQTLRELLGDVSGANALDMACGDGFYTRWLKRAGASQATGVDVSSEMIRRAEEEERSHPLGCEYRESDITAFTVSEPVDVVVAMYSLGYASSGEQLRRFCKACHDAVRPDGRQFEIKNFYLTRETYEDAFRAAGFLDFRWVDVSLQPSAPGNPFWDDFLAHPPIVAFAASR